MTMRFFACILCFAFACQTAGAFAATDDQSAVRIRSEQGDRLKLYVTGETYTMVVNCTDAIIEKFTVGEQDLIGDVPLCPTLNTGKVNGPGTVEIAQAGPAFGEIHLASLWWTDLKADIEIVLYCYRTRVFANVNVVPRGAAPDLMVGWYGGTKYSMPLLMQSEEELQKQVSFNGQDPKCAAVVAEPWVQFGLFGLKLATGTNYRNSIGRISGGYGYRGTFVGPRRASIILMGCRSNEELREAIRAEAAMSFAKVDVRGGDFGRYDGSKGFFRLERAKGSEGDLDFEIAFEPPPMEQTSTFGLTQRVTMALAKIDWKLSLVLLSLLAIVVFGFRARPQSGTFGARMRPKLLATFATVALALMVAWLFRLPAAPAPSALPMPRGPVQAVFQVLDTPGAGFLVDANGFPLPGPLQSRVRPDGVSETYFECSVAASGETRFVLRKAASPLISPKTGIGKGPQPIAGTSFHRSRVAGDVRVN